MTLSFESVTGVFEAMAGNSEENKALVPVQGKELEHKMELLILTICPS